MVIATKNGTIIKIQLLQGSPARNYFESKERLFLQTILSKIQNEPGNDLKISENEKDVLENIFQKYGRFLNQK